MSRGCAQAGILVTGGALLDLLARHRPDDTAVETGEQWTSYGQLLDLARAIREQITRNPVGPGPIVVADDPGASACATIAVAQALGRAYVPLSASHPATRIQQILAAVDPALIVQSERTATRLAHALPGGYPLLTISRQLDKLSWARSPDPVVNCASRIGNDIAYVMFTSGTTGRPKGVPVRIESLMEYLDVARKRFGVQPGDRVSHFFELTFDLSVHDVFVTLLGGATLVVIPPEQRMLPARFLREKEISHWFSVPSAAESLHRVGALRPEVFPHLRQTLFCGEPLHWSVTEAWQAAAPNSRIINLYGPTEATIAISYYVIPRRRPPSDDIYGIVPIGHVFEGQHGKIFSTGEVGERPNRGELWLSGSQVISGYLDGEDNHDAFVSSPDGVAWYRTGDAVEVDGDGLFHFVGRIDHQLKISGYRVEPAEIEDAIHRAFPGCRCVVVRCDRGKRRGLVAAIICKEGNAPAASDVQEACAGSLPAYMIPAHVVELVSWPVNANGKIDRTEVRHQLEEYVSPDIAAEHGTES
jgi:D-alanine--poly(phosphoribitol) ligase subunit 1